VLTGVVLLLIALAAAITVDVVKTGYGVKSDEATYVGMTLSLSNARSRALLGSVRNGP
jgi:hypothetical protein